MCSMLRKRRFMKTRNDRIIVPCKTADEPPQPVESLLSTEEELYRNGRLRHAQYGGKRVKVKATKNRLIEAFMIEISI